MSVIECEPHHSIYATITLPDPRFDQQGVVVVEDISADDERMVLILDRDQVWQLMQQLNSIHLKLQEHAA